MKKAFAIILSACFAVTAFAQAQPAKTPQQTAQEKAAAEKAAKEAAAKAEREKADANRKKYNEIFQKWQALVNQGKAAESGSLAMEIAAMYGQPGVAANHAMHIANSLGRAKNDKAALEFKVQFMNVAIEKTDGDIKVNLMTELANTLKTNKLADEKAIAKLLNDRYAVKNITPMRLFQLYVADNRLDEAEKTARAMIDAEKDSRKLGTLFSSIVRAFDGKKVFGSTYGQKFYLLWMEKAGTPLVINAYARYAQKYALLSEAEVQNLFDSRFSAPGITDTIKMELHLKDMTAEQFYAKEHFAKALAAAGNNEELQYKVYSALANTVNQWSDAPEWKAKTCREAILKPCVLNSKSFGHYLENFVNRFAAGNYKDTEELLLKLEQMFPAVSPQYRSICDAKTGFYLGAAKRYYEKEDPVLLDRAIKAQYAKLAVLPQNAGEFDQLKILLRIGDIAAMKGDLEQVTQAYFAAEKLTSRNMAHLDSQRIRFQLYLGRAAYANEDYATTVKCLEVFLAKAQPNGQDKQWMYEALTRSYLAMGNDVSAAKYAPLMLENAPRYMRSRLEPGVQELLQRVNAPCPVK